MPPMKPTSQTANVTLTVSKFVDVLTSEEPPGERNTECEMQAEPNHPQVTMTKGSKGAAPTLKVKGNGATICFQIKSKNPRHKYFPLGIAFRRRTNRGPNDNRDDILGRKDFSFGSMHLFGRSLYITDHFRNCGAGRRYKFSVLIQREHDGAIGIIDPGIENEP
jgi:hypothetical protein